MFNADGAWLGSVVVPSRSRTVQVGPDWALAIHMDDFDVEYVRVYTFDKP